MKSRFSAYSLGNVPDFLKGHRLKAVVNFYPILTISAVVSSVSVFSRKLVRLYPRRASPKPTRSQAYVRVIFHIAVKVRGLSIEALSGTEIPCLADDSLLRYPKNCDARFRNMAIGRVRVFQRSCGRGIFRNEKMFWEFREWTYPLR